MPRIVPMLPSFAASINRFPSTRSIDPGGGWRDVDGFGFHDACAAADGTDVVVVVVVVASPAPPASATAAALAFFAFFFFSFFFWFFEWFAPGVPLGVGSSS